MAESTLTPPEVARRWRCKPETVRSLLESGRLAGFTLSPPGTSRRRWRITLDAVLAYESGERLAESPKPARRRKRRREGIPQGPF